MKSTFGVKRLDGQLQGWVICKKLSGGCHNLNPRDAIDDDVTAQNVTRH